MAQWARVSGKGSGPVGSKLRVRSHPFVYVRFETEIYGGRLNL